MKSEDKKCSICEKSIEQMRTGEPFLQINNKCLCSTCYICLIPKIYEMAGCGDGGLIHLVFESCLQSDHNRAKRSQIKNYKQIFKKLLHKYNYKCVLCGDESDLSIDHICPVAEGGTDDLSNLQILCMTCNRKKGAKLYD